MGLSNGLNDAPTDSIPILFIAAAAALLSYLRHLLSSLLRLHGPPLAPDSTTSADLAALADFLCSNRAFAYDRLADAEDCVVCLCGMKGGERARRLSCCHVFHIECLDGWFDQMKLSCPLCRSPLVAA